MSKRKERKTEKERKKTKRIIKKIPCKDETFTRGSHKIRASDRRDASPQKIYAETRGEVEEKKKKKKKERINKNKTRWTVYVEPPLYRNQKKKKNTKKTNNN
eukprot:TRINITY_DN666_c0_g1_i1.p1 TRINITY_DN666_c0_g1~~TRINITY_DN666_c0_g1_i1.p1  ORF type:complete len:102 (+),score=6.97 TRINITY_DN666_c0_g1_i1:106-411(+)